MPNQGVVIAADGGRRVKQRGQQISLDVADMADVLLQAGENVFHVRAVDGPQPFLDQFRRVHVPGDFDHFLLCAERFHHQLHHLIQLLPVRRRDDVVVADVLADGFPQFLHRRTLLDGDGYGWMWICSVRMFYFSFFF